MSLESAHEFSRWPKPMRMNVLVTIVASVLAVVVSVPAVAQTANLTRQIFVEPKLGMTAEFETALRAHIEWRKSNNDPWNWSTYSVVNGDDFGQYVVRSTGHSWSDFDAYGTWETRTGDAQHFTSTVMPFVESFRQNISSLNLGLSRPVADLSAMTLFRLVSMDLSSPRGWFGASAKITAAAEQTNWSERWFISQVVNGGSDDAVLIFPAENWAGFEPPKRSLLEMLTEAYGPDEATAIMDQVELSVRSSATSTVQLRPDLSY